MKSFTGLLHSFLPTLGLDPDKFVQPFERAQLQRLLERHVGFVTDRLEAVHLTPALRAGNPSTERQWIRSALYLTLKAAVSTVLPQGRGANLVSD